MADLPSYPVKSDIQSSDRIVAFRTSSGEVIQVPFSVIQAAFEASFLRLTDTPGSYIGQQFKFPRVNSSEDGLEFVDSVLNPTFIGLPDTPASYAANGLKYPRVNSAANAIEFVNPAFLELDDTPATYAGQAAKQAVVNGTEDGLEFIDSEFISHTDTPSSYSGQANSFVTVNATEDALEFTVVDKTKIAFIGLLDYNHGGGTQAYTGGSGYVKILNDAAGSFTNTSYPPPSGAGKWDPVGNVFDFTSLKLGDMVDIRLDLSVTTTAINQEIIIDLYLADGTPAAYSVPYQNASFKSTGVQAINRYNGIYMGNSDTLDNPAYFRITSPDDFTLQVNGWYMKILERGV